MMETLQNIIEENIEWFWKNDPVVWCDENGVCRENPLPCDEETVDKFWIAFRDWCVQNCKDVCEENNMPITESFIQRLVLHNFGNWLNWEK